MPVLRLAVTARLADFLADAGGLLGVSEPGRLLRVDHGGRWLLGDSVEDGLRALTDSVP
ncbi:hypothetical protein ACWCP8_22945 [Streptomyces sp. NPDC002206]